MSLNLSEEITNAEDFHVKLRYFNEMISEIQSLLSLDAADIKITQDAEREVSAQMVRYRSANESVEQARAALVVSEQALARTRTELQLCTKQAHNLAEATIRTVEGNPQVRDTYKSGLRDIFSGAKTGIVTAVTDDGGHVPNGLKITQEGGSTVLCWQWHGAGAQNLRFEAAFAVGTATSYRGATTVTRGEQFVPTGSTEPGTEMRLAFVLDALSKAPVKKGAPVTYRVRTLTTSGAVGEWSEPLTVRHRQAASDKPAAQSGEPKHNTGWSRLFEIRTKNAG